MRDSYSPERQIGEEGDGEEDGGQATADVRDVGEDVGLQAVRYRLSGEILQSDNRQARTQKYITFTAPGIPKRFTL